MNPLSGHNEKSDLIAYDTTLVRTDNENFIRDNSQYGVFTAVDRSLKADRVNYVIPAIELCLGILILAVLLGITFYMQEDKWMLLWIWIGGIVGGFAGALLYFDARYKVLTVFALCSILSLIWGIVYVCRRRKTVNHKKEVEVILLQKDEDLEKPEI